MPSLLCPSTSYMKRENCPPKPPLERQGASSFTVEVDVSRGRPHSINQETRKKTRFYSEFCPWDLRWGRGRQGARGSWMDTLLLPLQKPQGRGFSSPTHG